MIDGRIRRFTIVLLDGLKLYRQLYDSDVTVDRRSVCHEVQEINERQMGVLRGRS